MNTPRVTINVALTLAPPAPGESREVVVTRCLAALRYLRIGIDTLHADPTHRAAITTFLRDMRLFLGPDLPPELKAFNSEWEALGGASAA